MLLIVIINHMRKELKIKYDEAAKTPSEPVFTIKDVKEILKLSSHMSVQRLDNEGLIKVKRNSQNYRIYSYNDIELLIKIHKLLKLNVPLKNIKVSMEFEKFKDRDPVKYLDEFAEFFTKRLYSENRNKARKLKKNK